MHRWLARYESDGLEGLGDRPSRPATGSTCDVLVTQGLFQFWVGNDLFRTVARTTPGAEIRKKHAERKAPL